jgi:hypothetical protein
VVARLAVLSLLAIVACASTDRTFIRRRLDFRYIEDSAQAERDIEVCRQVSTEVIRKTGMAQLEFITFVWDHCLVDRGYRLRDCRPTTFNVFACGGPGESPQE